MSTFPVPDPCRSESSRSTTTQTEQQRQSGLRRDVAVDKEHQTLLVRRNTLLVVDLGLDVLAGVVGLNLESNGVAGQSLHRDSRRECVPIL